MDEFEGLGPCIVLLNMQHIMVAMSWSSGMHAGGRG